MQSDCFGRHRLLLLSPLGYVNMGIAHPCFSPAYTQIKAPDEFVHLLSNDGCGHIIKVRGPHMM